MASVLLCIFPERVKGSQLLQVCDEIVSNFMPPHKAQSSAL